MESFSWCWHREADCTMYVLFDKYPKWNRSKETHSVAISRTLFARSVLRYYVSFVSELSMYFRVSYCTATWSVCPWCRHRPYKNTFFFSVSRLYSFIIWCVGRVGEFYRLWKRFLRLTLTVKWLLFFLLFSRSPSLYPSCSGCAKLINNNALRLAHSLNHTPHFEFHSSLRFFTNFFVFFLFFALLHFHLTGSRACVRSWRYK